MGTVYKITNLINNKSYIGYTTKTIQERWLQHKKLSQHPEQKDGNTVFYKALRKYGIDCWKVESLFESNEIEVLKEKEKYYIQYYNTFAFQDNSNGYNSTLGGDGVHGYNDKAVVAINPLTFNIECSYDNIQKAEKEHGRNIQETCARKINFHHNLIWYYRNEFEKMSKEELIKDVCNRINVYCQINFQGELINTFLNLTEFCNQNNFNQGNISECLAHRRQSSNGYIWCLYQDKEQYLNKIFKRKTNKERKINQYSLDGKFIKTWDSIKDALIFLNKNLKDSHISQVCRGKRNSAYGYKWSYAPDHNEEDYE